MITNCIFFHLNCNIFFKKTPLHLLFTPTISI